MVTTENVPGHRRRPEAVETLTRIYTLVSQHLSRWATRSNINIAGEVMITCGLIVLLFAAYEVWGKAAIVKSHQNDLDTALNQQWGEGKTTGSTADPTKPELAPPPGGSIARMHIPKINKHWVVVEGVDPKHIQFAPGHYPTSALPGQIGNFAVAGHRSPAIFWDLDRLKARDYIVVETRSAYHVYRVTRVFIVKPNAVEVVAPVPGRPGAKPTTAMLTLTTCNPKWDNTERLIVHATLISSQPRANGPPAQLRSG